MEFIEHESGLHYWNPAVKGMAFVETVSGNKDNYTKRQIKGAELARELYASLAYPSMRDFRIQVQLKQIADCPVTVDDIDVAQAIWGKSIAALKGKTVRKKPIPVVSSLIQVPREFLNLHKKVFLTVDMYYVNEVVFFVSLSRKICFTASTHLQNRKHASVMAAFSDAFTFYGQRGFHITLVHGDSEFESLRSQIEALPGKPRLNVAAPGEHVPEIERRIRVIKERCRAIRASLPFEQLPTIMVIQMVLHATKMLNYFPTSVGIGNGYSPRTLMTGEVLSYKTHLALKFGDYCQVHEIDEPRNSQLPRTQGAICMGPTSSIQPGFRFLNLKSGKTIVRRSWDRLPMPDTVIARVNRLGAGQPKQLVFKDRHGRLIGDVELPGVDDEPDTPGDLAGVDTDIALDDEEEAFDDPAALDGHEVDETQDINDDALDPEPEEATEPDNLDTPVEGMPPDEIPGVPHQDCLRNPRSAQVDPSQVPNKGSIRPQYDWFEVRNCYHAARRPWSTAPRLA